MFDALKRTAATLKRELRVYQTVRLDARTPRRARILLGLAIAYLVSPIDLIPDFIPVIGHLDDAIIVPLLVVLAMRSVPEIVLADARASVESASVAQPEDEPACPAGIHPDSGAIN